MKYTFSTLLFILFFAANAQNPDYEQALKTLDSEYAKSLFPEKKSKIELINDIPDTIYIDDKQTFRLLQFVQKKNNGEFDLKRTEQLFSFTLKDKELTHNEVLLLNACKHKVHFVLKNIGNEITFTPSPINITPKLNENAESTFTKLFNEGFGLNSYAQMKFFFENSKNGGDNWLTYYNNSSEKKEIAISYLIVRNYQAYKNSNLKNNFRPYHNFIDRMKVISIYGTTSKKVKQLIKDLIFEQYEKHRIGLKYKIEELGK